MCNCQCASHLKDFGTIERFIEPCILLLLSQKESHGYGLMEDLEKRCGEKVDIGNLYRTLRRMEKNGWVTSDWDKNDAGPDRRTYAVTTDGLHYLEEAIISLTRTDTILHHLLEGYKKMHHGDKIL